MKQIDLARHGKDIKRFIAAGDYEETDEGLIIHSAIRGRGVYVHSVGGKDERRDHNLIPAQGIEHILNVALGEVAKTPTWYLALFSGNVTPATNWTAANFAANATEIVSATEGYSNATRPEWVEAPAAAGKIGNLASRAVFNIVCSTTINIWGAALLSSNARGGTSGVLLSASKYANVRTVNNGDPFELGYEVELTDS